MTKEAFYFGAMYNDGHSLYSGSGDIIYDYTHHKLPIKYDHLDGQILAYYMAIYG